MPDGLCIPDPFPQVLYSESDWILQIKPPWVDCPLNTESKFHSNTLSLDALQKLKSLWVEFEKHMEVTGLECPNNNALGCRCK